jgi:hypothetical protein
LPSSDIDNRILAGGGVKLPGVFILSGQDDGKFGLDLIFSQYFVGIRHGIPLT